MIGATLVHRFYSRIVTLHPGNVIKKCGRGVCPYEVDGLRVAEAAGLPVPHPYGAETTPDGVTRVAMSYVEGQALSDVWATLSPDGRKAVARQLRDIVGVMRAVPAPAAYIGACGGNQIRDRRSITTHMAPPCTSEAEFNNFLLSSLFDKIPQPIYKAFARRLRTGHRIVLTHGDLAPRNIMVKDGRITALVDWEEAGWYPEYWEYVKFFLYTGPDGREWAAYADIFADAYPDELVDSFALSKWQVP